MELANVMDQVYYSLTLNELRMMNQSPLGQAMSYNSMLYLHLIMYREDCTVSYLAGALHVSKPAVTAKVNELQRMGLVEKQQSGQDKRVFYLRPTAAAKENYKAYDQAFGRAMSTVQAQYSPEETRLLCHMLQAFQKEITEIDTEKLTGTKI